LLAYCLAATRIRIRLPTIFHDDNENELAISNDGASQSARRDIQLSLKFARANISDSECLSVCVRHIHFTRATKTTESETRPPQSSSSPLSVAEDQNSPPSIHLGRGRGSRSVSSLDLTSSGHSPSISCNVGIANQLALKMSRQPGAYWSCGRTERPV